MTSSKTNFYAIILCGGSGSRLWPRSRSNHPKHLLKLNGAKTLVQETVRRINIPVDRIFCITEASHADLLKQQLPNIPDGNIIIEPDRRGTASAIGLCLAVMKDQIKPDSVVVSLHADHLIQNKDNFQATVAAWAEAARRLPRIITLGINPTYPSTGLGYIKTGQQLEKIGKFEVLKIDKFVEKPTEATARTYLKSGQYLWNAGLFAAKYSVFEEEFKTHLPDMVKKVTASAKAIREGQITRAKRQYLSLESETIDYGVLEKSKNLAVVPATFDWADVGSWADLHDLLERDHDGNVFEGEYVDIDSHNCFIYSPKQLVATVGLDNLVIINTKDAVLICPKDRAQDVKKVVEKMKSSGKVKYL